MADLATHGVTPHEKWAFEMFRYGAMLGFVYPVIAAGALTIDDPRHIELCRSMLIRSVTALEALDRVRLEFVDRLQELARSFSMFSSVFSIASRVCACTFSAAQEHLRALLL